ALRTSDMPESCELTASPCGRLRMPVRRIFRRGGNLLVAREKQPQNRALEELCDPFLHKPRMYHDRRRQRGDWLHQRVICDVFSIPWRIERPVPRDHARPERHVEPGAAVVLVNQPCISWWRAQFLKTFVRKEMMVAIIVKDRDARNLP